MSGNKDARNGGKMKLDNGHGNGITKNNKCTYQEFDENTATINRFLGNHLNPTATPLTLDIVSGRATGRHINPFLTNNSKTKGRHSAPVSYPDRNDDDDDFDGEPNHCPLIRRSSLICSSGKDKYTYDSETGETPSRSIDTYEKQLSFQSNASSTISSGSGGIFGSTISKLSSFNEDISADRHSSLNQHEKPPNFVTNHNDSLLVSSPNPSILSSNYHQTNHEDLNGQDSASVSRVRIERKSVVQGAYQPIKSNIINGRYQNPWNTWIPVKFTNIVKFGLTRGKSNLPKKEVSSLGNKIGSQFLRRMHMKVCALICCEIDCLMPKLCSTGWFHLFST